MVFTEFLKQSADEIELEIQKFFNEWNKETEHISPRIKPHLKALKDAAKGGKRIRGALVILGNALVSKDPHPDLLKVAVAYELFQTAILAHDDIIDKSPKRRGKPSLPMALGGGHYGMSQAICLGDVGFFLAYKLIAESSFDDAIKTKAIAFFSDSIIKTTIGEMLDVELTFSKTEVTQKDILAITRLKTAYYTFVAPLTLGAILGGSDRTWLKHLQTYGEHVGIAFQLQDDSNDIFGSEKKLKKQVCGDIREGKQTLLVKKAIEKSNAKELEILKKYYGNAAITDQEIEEVKKVMEQTGAQEYTQKLSKEYGRKARAVIPAITTEGHLQALLNDIIDFIV